MPREDETMRLVPVEPTEAMIEAGCQIEVRASCHHDGITATVLRDRSDKGGVQTIYRAMVAVAPAPATARGGDALRIAVARLKAAMAEPVDVRLTAHMDDLRTVLAALASQPQATGGAVEREAIARIIDPKAWATRNSQYRDIERSPWIEDKTTARMSADAYVHDSLAKADAILAALATQPAPSPGGDGHIPPVSEATIAAYEDAHAVSVEMGYPSITEALEHLSELLEPAAPSIQKGDE